MKNKFIYIVVALLISFVSFGQSKKLADRYFKEFNYPKAVEMYKSLYKKGDTSKFVIKRIAKCYYNNSQVVDSEMWYEKLIKLHRPIVSEQTLFEYAQSIRSNGNYKKSDSLLATLSRYNLEDVGKKTTFLLDNENSKDMNISLRNLKINTEYSDFGGFMFNDKVYFASAAPVVGRKNKLYKWNGQPFLNLYKSSAKVTFAENDDPRVKKTKIYVLEDKELLPAPVSTQYHESNAVITKDGKTMYFTRLNYDGKKLDKDNKDVVNLKIYKAKLINNKWSEIEELPFNSKHYSVGHPALSVDEKTLYFVSDMPGSIGKSDIYKVAITADGYGEPVNLGRMINTPGKEMFPYVSADNTLYFSSDGHAGLGLMDIFQSKITKEGTAYSKPKNLEYPFNSKRDDFSFYIDAKGEKGFFSSNRANGKGDDDIYSFIIERIKKKPKPCLQHIAGVVKDKVTKEIIPAATVKLINTKGEVFKEMLSDDKGLYKFSDIACGQKFTVRGTKLNYRPDTKDVATTKERGKTIVANLDLDPMIVGNQIVIKPIYFNFNKATIREDAKYELEDIVTVMNNNPKMKIKIESHTDSRGSARYNRSLSDRRAKSTRRYIISRGIDGSRIVSAIGYGEDRLLNHCDDAHKNKCTEEEHQLNRRSYFIIVSGAPNVKVNNTKPTTIDHKPGR